MNKKVFFFLLFAGFLYGRTLQAANDGAANAAATNDARNNEIVAEVPAVQPTPVARFSLTQTLGQLAVNFVGAYGAWDLVRLGAAAARNALTANPPGTILVGVLAAAVMVPSLWWHSQNINTAAHNHSETLWSVAKRTVQGFGLAAFGWGAWKLGQYVVPFVRAHQQSASLFGVAALSGLFVPWLRDINFSDWLTKIKVQSPVTTAT